MWSWRAKEGGGAGGKRLGRKVPILFLITTLFISFPTWFSTTTLFISFPIWLLITLTTLLIFPNWFSITTIFIFVHQFGCWYPHRTSFAQFCLFPPSIWYQSWQVQHDLCGDKRQGQHRGGTSNLAMNPILLSFTFCIRLIRRLSLSWWTECCKALASGVPAKHLPPMLRPPHRLWDLLSWG